MNDHAKQPTHWQPSSTVEVFRLPRRPRQCICLGGLMLAVLFFADSLPAVTPSPAEFRVCRQWTASVFHSGPRTQHPSLKLLYQDAPDGVTRGRSWRGTPFQIGSKTYSHGLAFNATKYLLVQLGQPGDRFIADVGLENNDDTRRGAAMGQGSVVFHVLVGGKEVFTSPVLRLKDGPRSINLPLHGARQFEIRVTDAGDGRGWDQALWGGAVVKLQNGSTLRLQDLPWAGAPNSNPDLVSFVFAGKLSTTLLPHWSRTIHGAGATSAGSHRTLSFTDPASGLQVRIEAQRFRDFPAVEWVAYFKNTGAKDTPLIENIQALDTALTLPASGNPTLHWAKGALASFDDFAPQDFALKPGAKLHLEPGGGRSSSSVLPFFNLEGTSGGVILAVGWTGEWAANFGCASPDTVSVKTGMAHTHLVLHPGEQIRTPRVLLLFYRGDRWRGQNLLRQFILTHDRPTLNGQPLIMPITCGNWGGTPASVHLDNIRQIIRHHLPIKYYWIDAEWFGHGGWPQSVGDWTVKQNLYPHGFKPLSDALRKSGRELMLWFEPERVYKGTPWYRDHHAWLFDDGGSSCLLNLGNPAARRFLTRFISDRIDEFGLGCYRQDFNIEPLHFWHAADAPDRQGIAEIRHIEGLYTFWDDLLKQHPGLIIDNCASGGRRIDLETVGRATPFWRTDGPRDPIAHQCHTYGLLQWVPLSSTSEDRAGDNYEFRSSMCSGLCLNWWVSGDVPAERIPANFPFAWARHTLRQYLAIRKFYYGDYYPLTGYSQARDVWMAYQLDRPDLGAGLVVALRRPQSPYETAQFALHGLEPDATYAVTNLDTGKTQEQTGRELQHQGLSVGIDKMPGSALLTYRKK